MINPNQCTQDIAILTTRFHQFTNSNFTYYPTDPFPSPSEIQSTSWIRILTLIIDLLLLLFIIIVMYLLRE